MKIAIKDKKRIAKTVLRWLPAAIVVVALVLYGLTFRTLSESKMKHSVALVEYVSYYELDVDGKSVAWFRAIGDSLSPIGLDVETSRNASDTCLLTGVWVNRFDFVPSCHGRILLPSPDTLVHKTVTEADKNAAAVAQRGKNDLEKELSRLNRKAARMRYYIRTHNVNDDGYNTMAAYSANIDDRREKVVKILSALGKVTPKSKASIRHTANYTLLYRASDGKTARTECKKLTAEGSHAFNIIQTKRRKKPHGASALYFHQWLTPTLVGGEDIVVASYHGCQQRSFDTSDLSQGTFPGTVTADGGHDVPSLFAPDGSPCFTRGGRLAGLTVKGRVLPTQSFSFGFNDLLP